MGATLVPDRELTTTVGLDDDDHFITLWATRWVLRGQLVDQTPWVTSPRKAIRLADDMDAGYQQVLVRTCA
jgi:hypothetical protein